MKPPCKRMALGATGVAFKVVDWLTMEGPILPELFQGIMCCAGCIVYAVVIAQRKEAHEAGSDNDGAHNNAHGGEQHFLGGIWLELLQFMLHLCDLAPELLRSLLFFCHIIIYYKVLRDCVNYQNRQPSRGKVYNCNYSRGGHRLPDEGRQLPDGGCGARHIAAPGDREKPTPNPLLASVSTFRHHR